MSSTLARETRRLGRVMRRAMWTTFAAGQIAVSYLACSSSSSTSTGSGGATSAGGAGADSTSTSGVGSGGGGGAIDGGCDPVTFLPDAADDCGTYMHFACGLPKGATLEPACVLDHKGCNRACGEMVFECHVVGDACPDGSFLADAKGGVDLDCDMCLNGVGRIPAGLAPVRAVRARPTVGDHFAAAAELEAASVFAFRLLQDDLAAHDGPDELIRAARRAELDERRHARATAKIARRFGGAPSRPRVARVPRRGLVAVALENAVEGCVRETFGALVVTWQAAHAADPDVAAALGRIARDETRHAALAWAVARWADTKIDRGARGRTRRACLEAIASLRRRSSVELSRKDARIAGFPDHATRLRMIAALERDAWAAFAREPA